MKLNEFRALKLTRFAASRIFCLLIIMAVTSQVLPAAVSGGQDLKDVKLNIQFRDVSLTEIFSAIESQTSFTFGYDRHIIQEKLHLKLSVNGDNLHDILQSVAEQAKVRFKRINRTIYVLPAEGGDNGLPGVEEARAGVVSGTVVDGETGEPLVGVSIVVAETTVGTTTDVEGRYSLSLPEGAQKLIFSFIGYVNEEVLIGNQSVIDVSMTTDIQKLSEIVIIGYGESAVENVTGAISSTKSETISRYAGPGFVQALSGTVSGVLINENVTTPGEDAQIVIRGTGTLTAGTDPLIVVDGFPLSEGSSLSSINPRDIASVEVLKDAASSAIYGSRAGNGVLLITTKKGKTGSMKVNLDIYGGVQERTDKMELVGAYDAAQYFKEARDWGYVVKDPVNRSENDDNATRLAKGANRRELLLDYTRPYLDGESGLTNTDWYDEILNAASINSYNASISGATDKVNYFVSGGYIRQEGIVLGSSLDRYANNIKLHTQLSDKVDFGINLNTSLSEQNFVPSDGNWNDPVDPVNVGMIMYPFFSPYNDDGSLAISEQINTNIPGDGALAENPVAMVKTTKNKREKFQSFGSAYLNVNLVEGLVFKTSLGGSYRKDLYDFYSPSFVGKYRTAAPKPATGSETNIGIRNFLTENTLNYNGSFGSHDLDVLLGYTYQEETGNQTIVTASGIPDDNIPNIAGGSSFSAAIDRYKWTQISYLARAQYGYNSRYLLSIAVRSDGSSRFGDQSKWGIFPSVSAGWILSRESFFPDINFISFAKLRASWGKTGNNQIGAYRSKGLVNPDSYVYEGALAPGFATTSSPNPNLSWETNQSFNAGLDLGLAEDKVSLSVNYYSSVTSDLLLDVPVPQQSGYSTSIQNIGKIENKGFEVEVRGKDFYVGGLSIGFNANFTSNDNKVLALGPDQDQIITGTNGAFRTKVGRPIAELYGYKVTGVYKSQEEINNTPHLAGTLTGDYIVEDVNGDGVVDDQDRIGFGTYAPDFTYAFGSSLGFKNFDFSFTFVGVEGRQVYDRMLHTFLDVGEGFSMPSQYYFDNRYHPVNNPEGTFAQPNTGSFSSARRNTRASSVFFNAADYLRLRTVQLGYTFSQKALYRIGNPDQLRVYISANNLFTFTKFRGFNPDSTSNETLAQGDAWTSHPVSRIITLGLNVTF